MSDADIISFARFPDTYTVRSTLKFIREHLDAPSHNHVVRSAFFSLQIATNITESSVDSHLTPVDKEILVVANLLHDMAWNPQLPTTRQFVSKDKRFEVDGANAAREFLRTVPDDHRWDARRVQLVWDAIALHSTASIAWHKEAEVAICQYGILVDVIGAAQLPLPGIPEMCQVSQQDFDAIYSKFPSLKLAGYLKNAMCALCEEKPESTYESFVGFYGEEYVEHFTLKGNTIVDLMKAREEAEMVNDGRERGY